MVVGTTGRVLGNRKQIQRTSDTAMVALFGLPATFELFF